MQSGISPLDILIPKIPGIAHKFPSFIDAFDSLYASADAMKLASGYISADSLLRLQNLVDNSRSKKLNILIGMHFFEGFTASQLQAARHIICPSKSGLGQIYEKTC